MKYLDYVTVFTIDCPKCKVLEKKLQQKGIIYDTVSDIERLKELGISQFPQMMVNCGHLMSFKEAVEWINGLE